jgi:lysophospholipid acyltransferase (LPLAT)-like uncharacterized protein
LVLVVLVVVLLLVLAGCSRLLRREAEAVIKAIVSPSADIKSRGAALLVRLGVRVVVGVGIVGREAASTNTQGASAAAAKFLFALSRCSLVSPASLASLAL